MTDIWTKLTALVGLCLLALALAQPPARADEAQDQQDIQIISNALRDGALEFEYGVPAAPALTIIGADGDAIPRTANLQRFAISVLRAAETAGGGGAYGFDASPFWLADQPISLTAYQRAGFFGRALRRSRMSAAFSEGDEKTSSRAAIGFATSLLSSADPVMVRARALPETMRADNLAAGYDLDQPLFSGCILPAVRAARDLDTRIVDAIAANSLAANGAGPRVGNPRDLPAVKAVIDEVNAAYEAAIEDRVAQCQKLTIEEARRGQALDLGLAFQWRGSPGDLEQLDTAGGTLWATYLSPAIGRREPDSEGRPHALIRAIAHVRYDIDTIDFDDNSNQVEYDRIGIAIGAERTSPRSALSLQAAYDSSSGGPSGTQWNGESTRYLARADLNLSRYGVTALGDGAWLSASIGAIDRSDSEDDTYVSVAIRFKAPDGAPDFPDSWANRGN